MGIDPGAVPGMPSELAPPKTIADKLPTDVGALLKNSGGFGSAARFPGLPGLGGGFVPRKK
jgi:signal recognition particle subunit SRP54